MKILFTGFTSITASEKAKDKRPYFLGSHTVIDCLRELGHSVEQRYVNVGEDLDKYDLVIVCPAPLGGFTSGRFMGAVWAHRQSKGKRIIFIDDWKLKEAQKSLKGFLKHSDKNWTKDVMFYDLPKAHKFKKEINETIEELSGPWSHISAPTLGGLGDPAGLRIDAEGPYAFFDLNSRYAGQYGSYESHESPKKERRWIIASLTDRGSWFKKLNFTWPQTFYGVKSQGQERIPERELFAHYTKVRGAFLPPANITGLWYRSTFRLACEARCVLFGSSSDLIDVGPEYVLNLSEVEALSDTELDELTNRQAARFTELAWNKETLMQYFNETFIELAQA